MGYENYDYVIEYFLEKGIDIREGGVIIDPRESIDLTLHRRMSELINVQFPYKNGVSNIESYGIR
jgi:hypothetical protein